MYPPREIYTFLSSTSFRSIVGKSFYKRHMESEDGKSPFADPADIHILEYLIGQGYVLAQYRGDAGVDNEEYLISTLGHAFLQNFSTSKNFRYRAYIAYYKEWYVLVLTSFVGSFFANILLLYFI